MDCKQGEKIFLVPRCLKTKCRYGARNPRTGYCPRKYENIKIPDYCIDPELLSAENTPRQNTPPSRRLLDKTPQNAPNNSVRRSGQNLLPLFNSISQSPRTPPPLLITPARENLGHRITKNIEDMENDNENVQNISDITDEDDSDDEADEDDDEDEDEDEDEDDEKSENLESDDDDVDDENEEDNSYGNDDFIDRTFQENEEELQHLAQWRKELGKINNDRKNKFKEKINKIFPLEKRKRKK